MSSTDSESESVVRGWVESIVDREDTIRQLLERIKEKQLYDGDKARDITKKFAENSSNRDAFTGLYFTLQGDEEFFEDVKEVSDEESQATLRQISEDYSEIEDEFAVVYEEEFEGMINPVTEHNSAVRHLAGEHGDPLITFQAHSGSAKMTDVRLPPSGLLDLAARITGSVERELKIRDRDDLLSESEKKAISDECQHAKRHIEEIEQFVEDTENGEE